MTDEERSERAMLQRRIKHQRAALRELNKTIRIYSGLVDRLRLERNAARATAYRHVATLAESNPWWFGWMFARVIRKWL